MKYKESEEEKPCPVKALIDTLNVELSLIESAVETSRKLLEQIVTLLKNENDD